MIVAVHLLTVKHGEVYLHHGWLLLVVVVWCAAIAGAGHKK